MKRPESIPYHRWHIAPAMPPDIKRQFDQVPPVLLQILYNRRIIEPGEVQAFLEGRYLKSTDPFLLDDMDKAVERIEQAVANGETIVVYGDFDADGVTSTVLLTEALRALGLSRERAQPYIPDRVDEGYGLNTEALTKLKMERGADLVISVDCGIRSIREVAHANEIGLDMIITDHHSLGAKLPPAVAVINPQRPTSRYPESKLAGVGIAYKLAQALHQTLGSAIQFQPEDLLDLVALGTVADLAPLLGENRQLVMAGLEVLNQAKRPGIAALAKVARIRPGALTAESIGFGLGPRINAAGRIGHAYTAARLLATDNDLIAIPLADTLNELNRRRQQLTADLSARAEAMIDPQAPIIIAADDSFLSGVVGLVASRLAEKNYRPAVVIEKGELESRASCRSIPEFHITQALDQISDLLIRHGGHAQAAGFTVLTEHIPALTQRLTGIAEEKLAGTELYPSIEIDMELDLDRVDWAMYANLAQLEPTGQENDAPIFMSREVEVLSHRAVGQDGAHLQLRLANPDRDGQRHQALPAIAFRQGAWDAQMPQLIDVVYTLNVNEWNGRRDLQLMVKDLRPSNSQ